MAFQLIQTKIKVEGTSEEIIFVNLVINQYLADVNAFSFTWRQPEGQSTLAAHVSFYQKNLSKTVTINIDNNLSFKGIIYGINCSNQDSLGVSYDIIGKGLFMKLDEVPECNSFSKQNLNQIFGKVNNTQGTNLKLSPVYTKELFYTVQYNQTGFEFMRMMAARHGEWFYYTGTDMVLGKPGSDSISLKQGEDVHDLDITAKLVKASHKISGFDHYKGDVINGEMKEAAKGGSFMEKSLKAGDESFGSDQGPSHVSNAVNNDFLKLISKLKQQAVAASSVFITARSYNSKLKLAGKIKLLDEKGGSAGEYIITEIHHTCITDNNYQNHCVAIPAEADVPPYTNPQLFAICKPQPALVTDNEDKDGLDRIKVHFPWMPTNATTPWITVLTPHAGKDKGFRFLPELHEEVMVGFLDNNSERPFVMGAVHTEKNKSGNDHTTNNIKVIGTKTGRRTEIDDDKGTMAVSDNYKGKVPKNILMYLRKDDDLSLALASEKTKNDISKILMIKDEQIEISLTTGGDTVAIITFKKDKSITITSKGKIDIKADGDMSLNASNITIKATQELKLEGTAKGISAKGQKIELKADTTMDVKGLTTTVEGTMKADFKAGAMTSITGAIVKIN